MRKLRRVGWITVLLGTAAACSASSSSSNVGDAEPAPSFGSIAPATDPYDPDAAVSLRIRALFTSCGGGPETSCHSIGTGGLALRLGSDGDVVNVRSSERPELMRVRPFDPLESYLYLKVLGDGGIEGGRMPLGGSADPRTAALVETWIEAGAP